jgi:hypothetical protein
MMPQQDPKPKFQAIQTSAEVDFDDATADQIIYSNVATVVLSPDDCVITLGVRDPDEPSKALTVAKVFLSIPHAKRLAITLGGVMRAYEEAFGTIVANPEEMLTPEFKERLKRQGKP